MIAIIAVFAFASFVFGAIITILALIVIGIHRDERRKNLTCDPGSHAEVITRRVLGVGVINGTGRDDHGED